MSKKVKILRFIKITNHGVYPYLVEDNKYLGRLITKDCMEWRDLSCLGGPSCRKNGPAIHTTDYSGQMWYTELYKGKHRLDGPQMVYTNGDVEYWVHDKYICDNEADFKKWKKIKLLM